MRKPNARIYPREGLAGLEPVTHVPLIRPSVEVTHGHDRIAPHHAPSSR